MVDLNTADGNRFNGVFVQTSDGAVVTHDSADDKDEYVFFVTNSPPIDDVADLVATMSTATGNTVLDFRVD